MRPFTPVITMMLPLVSCFLSSCGGGGGANENRSNRGLNPGVGPFDRHGNYVESWADDQSKGVAWRADHVVGEPQLAKAEEPTPIIYPPVVSSKVTSQPQPTLRPSRSKPSVSRATTTSSVKPKSTIKTKPKSKAPLRYTIKKGDTLYALSLKYKTSVSSIQRANGLKGTNLRIGRTLLIPRY